MHIFVIPHLKHIVLLIGLVVYCVALFWFGRKFFKDPALHNWILASLSVNNDPAKGSSGKALTAMLFANMTALCTVLAVVYDKNHLLPDYYLISILTTILILYGIKVTSKFVSTGDNSTNTNTTVTSNTSNTNQTNTTLTGGSNNQNGGSNNQNQDNSNTPPTQ